jgi:hypothetical protein
MTSLINNRYQFDPTGQANSNLIVDEVHSVPQNGARLIIAREGLFYTREFTVRPASGGPQLVLNQDYHYISMDEEITAQTGLETATGIEFDDPALFGDFIITYHAVGGVEGNSNKLMQDLKAAIELAKNSPVDWNKLINVPAQFPPEWHPHEVTDLNGLEAVKDALNRLELAIYDSRPLELSGLNLHWQDQRILHLLATFNDRLNGILARVIDLNIEALVDAAVADRLSDLDARIQAAVDAKMAEHIANYHSGTGGGGTGTAPDVTGMTGTPDGVILATTPGELDWSDVTGATGYDVYINNALVASDVTASRYVPSASLVDGAYTWHVVAKNAAGSTQGPTWTFTIDSTITVTVPDVTGMTGTPDQVTLQNPPTLFDWTAVTGADTYDVYLDGTQVATGLTDSQWVPDITITDTGHTWYVVAINTAGSAQGPTWNFIVNPASTTGDTIYDAGEFGVTPVADPGEILEPDLIDAGLNPSTVTEPYVGLVVYDAGGISGPTSPIPPGAEIEPDIIDLNPQP